MVSRISQSIQEAVSIRVATDTGNMATRMGNAFTDALKEKFSQLIPEMETMLDERFAKLERSLLDGVMAEKAAVVLEETIDVPGVLAHDTEKEDSGRSADGTGQDTPSDTSNFSVPRRKRRISISPEPDCDLATYLEVEVPPKLAEHDLSIDVSARSDVQTHSDIVCGEQAVVLSALHASPNGGGDISVGRSYLLLLPAR